MALYHHDCRYYNCFQHNFGERNMALIYSFALFMTYIIYVISACAQNKNFVLPSVHNEILSGAQFILQDGKFYRHDISLK